MEILSWLPVKYVLRMKCVCKQWYALTQDCQFIEKHMSRVKILLTFTILAQFVVLLPAVVVAVAGKFSS